MVACVWVAAVPAAHGEPSVADRATARALLLDGRAKMEAKDHAGALKAFQGAHAIMNVPTTGLDLAKAHAALGQLLEAREVALSVTRSPAKVDDPEAFADARKAAEVLAAGLDPRIPSVVISVAGPAPEGVSITLDGAALAVATLSLPRKVNPGRHRIVVSAPGFEEGAREVDVAEGTSVPVEMSLARAVTAASAQPIASSGVTAAPVVTSAAVGTSAAVVTSAAVGTAAPAVTGAAGAARTPGWAWAAGGAGLVALGVGVGFFVDYLGVRDRVAKECPGDVCDPRLHDVSSAQGLRAQWNRDLGVTVAMGAVAIAGIGVAIVGIAGASSKQAATSVVVRARAGGLSLEGAF